MAHSNRKPTIDEVREETSRLSNGRTSLVSTEYHNCIERLTFKCACGNEFTRAWRKYRMGKILCPACAYKLSGEKRSNPNKKRRVKSEKRVKRTKQKRTCVKKRNPAVDHTPCSAVGKRTLHKRLKSWRKRIRTIYNGTCPITGERENTVVHHLISLDTIYSNTAKEYGFDCLLKKEASFSDKEQYYQIVREVRRRHTDQTGILIADSVHRKFHKEYGYGNNTPTQFNEFLINNYQLSLYDIQKARKIIC